MNWKRVMTGLCTAAILMSMPLLLSGCNNAADQNSDKTGQTQDQANTPKDTTSSAAAAIEGATQDGQELLVQIDVSETQAVAVWTNLDGDKKKPFTLGLVEKKEDKWEVTQTDGVTMQDNFFGGGMYPNKDALITYAVSPSESDDVHKNYEFHQATEQWAFSWTVVPKLPA